LTNALAFCLAGLLILFGGTIDKTLIKYHHPGKTTDIIFFLTISQQFYGFKNLLFVWNTCNASHQQQQKAERRGTPLFAGRWM